MVQVTAAEAKARLSSLLDAVENGQSVVITRRGKAIAELVPRRSGCDLLPQLQALRIPCPSKPPARWMTSSPCGCRCKAQRGSGTSQGLINSRPMLAGKSAHVDPVPLHRAGRSAHGCECPGPPDIRIKWQFSQYKGSIGRAFPAADTSIDGAAEPLGALQPALLPLLPGHPALGYRGHAGYFLHGLACESQAASAGIG